MKSLFLILAAVALAGCQKQEDITATITEDKVIFSRPIKVFDRAAIISTGTYYVDEIALSTEVFRGWRKK